MENNFWEWLLIAIVILAIFNINRLPEIKSLLESQFQTLSQKAKEGKKELERKVNETKENIAKKNEAAQKAK